MAKNFSDFETRWFWKTFGRFFLHFTVLFLSTLYLGTKITRFKSNCCFQRKAEVVILNVLKVSFTVIAGSNRISRKMLFYCLIFLFVCRGTNASLRGFLWKKKIQFYSVQVIASGFRDFGIVCFFFFKKYIAVFFNSLFLVLFFLLIT